VIFELHSFIYAEARDEVLAVVWKSVLFRYFSWPSTLL
jgi:hypothetical protein